MGDKENEIRAHSKWCLFVSGEDDDKLLYDIAIDVVVGGPDRPTFFA